MINAVKHVKCSSKQFHTFNTDKNYQQHAYKIEVKNKYEKFKILIQSEQQFSYQEYHMITIESEQ